MTLDIRFPKKSLTFSVTSHLAVTNSVTPRHIMTDTAGHASSHRTIYSSELYLVSLLLRHTVSFRVTPSLHNTCAAFHAAACRICFTLHHVAISELSGLWGVSPLGQRLSTLLGISDRVLSVPFAHSSAFVCPPHLPLCVPTEDSGCPPTPVLSAPSCSLERILSGLFPVCPARAVPVAVE